MKFIAKIQFVTKIPLHDYVLEKKEHHAFIGREPLSKGAHELTLTMRWLRH